MASIFGDFKDGHKLGSGPRLAESLTPTAPPEEPHRLREFYHFTNPDSLHPGLRYCLFHDNGPRLSKQEQNAWTEIYSAFWAVAGELLRFDSEGAGRVAGANGKASWARVFDAWKELANVLIRGYSSGALQAWTLPCLYIAGKFLRVFAMKADAEIAARGGGAMGSFRDDFVSEFDNAKLEDAARTINRMFTLCLSDRWVARFKLGSVGFGWLIV